MKKINNKAILFGDEIGLPTLVSISKNLGISVLAAVVSKKIPPNFFENEFVSKMKIFYISDLQEDNQIEIQKFIIDNGITIGMMYSFDTLIRRLVLGIANFRLINFHAGKLPDYRGANVLNWVLINGEKTCHVTLHEVSEKIDAGPIIYEWSIDIEDAETALTLRTKICEILESKAGLVVEKYLAGSISAVPQAKDTFFYHKRRTPNDGLFDWSKSDLEIYNLIRALVYPWPGARFLSKHGDLIIIDQFKTLEEVKLLRKTHETSSRYVQ